MNPSQPRLLRVEAVADLPVLWATFQRLELPATLDRHFPAPLHWKGPLTPGEVLAVWLLFLVSRGDHCLNHVQPWVAQHQGTLSALLGKRVLPHCFAQLLLRIFPGLSSLLPLRLQNLVDRGMSPRTLGLLHLRARLL